jgi:hypothetical protein
VFVLCWSTDRLILRSFDLFNVVVFVLC